MRYLLFYEKVPDHAEREAPLHAAHRAHLEAAVRRGELVLGGCVDNPDDGAAVMLFQADSRAVPETFASGDPYVVLGVVNRWWVRAWDAVAGTALLTRPGSA